MTRLTRSTTLAVLCAAILVPARGSAQDLRKSAPPISRQQITAALKVNAATRLARLKAENDQRRQLAARQVQTAASQIAAKLGARVRLRVDTMQPVVDTVVAPVGGVEPGVTFEVLGANLYKSGRPEVRIVLAGKEMVANFMGGGTVQGSIRAYAPDFTGIAAPTPAQLYVLVGSTKSNLAPILLKPELDQKVLDVAALKSTLIADSHGTNLTFAPDCNGPNCYEITDQTSIGGIHNAPYKSPPASGMDYYFSTYKLKNNWVVKDTLWWNPVSFGAPGQTTAKATIVLGTSALATSVSWWLSDGSSWQAYYYISYILQGPKGVPYN